MLARRASLHACFRASTPLCADRPSAEGRSNNRTPLQSRGVVAGAWDLLCSDGITTNDNKLPPLCHPQLA